MPAAQRSFSESAPTESVAPVPIRAASFKKLQRLFPIAVTLHNCEEAFWMPGCLFGITVPTALAVLILVTFSGGTIRI